MDTISNQSSILPAVDDPRVVRRRSWRMLKDKLVRHGMTFGGISIILAIVLIFFYLLYVVYPILMPADMHQAQEFVMPAGQEKGKTLYIATEEKAEVGVRFTDQGYIVFFSLHNGAVLKEQAVSLPADTSITSIGMSDTAKRVVAFGLSNGTAIVVQHNYAITYPNDKALITPEIAYPLGEEAIVVDEQGRALTHLAIQIGEEANTLAAVTKDNQFILSGFVKETSFIDESVSLEKVSSSLDLHSAVITHILVDKEQRISYLADTEGRIHSIDISDPAAPVVMSKTSVVNPTQKITALSFLTGDISLVIGRDDGIVMQWFPVRSDTGDKILRKIREFDQQQGQSITGIIAEERRKGFAVFDASGRVGIYHSTAHNNLILDSITDKNIAVAAFSPRADVLVTEDTQGHYKTWDVENEHPEVSWSALWNKVWYESYDEPAYIWQSSSASNDFEPKFSLTPLAFGTLKAAFYAMIVAVPLAILGAIYAAYFMAPQMRRVVKPTIEIMEALPTVILGFLAGLWLAPVVESHLAGVFIMFILIPISVFLSAYLWRFAPKSLRYRLGAGWEGALLIPVILLVAWFSFAISPVIENLFFGGSMTQWLESIGIGFDQRNALVVGMTMGLAVIPSIFSIAEDAIFSVPKHLTTGSLALGATPWQTMIRVVLLTASPGIFSAIMIGLGRAVGETMIVLMATGNTPVMDFSIFQGLRTLSANIAVEMPESEVGSTHYRILFLAALTLFMFTFFFNTVAEVIRQRLRRKYSSL